MTDLLRSVAAVRLGLAWLGALLFAASGAMLTWEVVARYFFTRPTIWAAELSQLCLIWGVLLSMAWALEARRHIAVDALVANIPAAARRWTEAVAMLCVAAFSGVTTWYGWEIFWDSFVRGRTTGSMLDLPTWVAELSVPLGFAMLFLQALAEIAKAFRTDWATHAEGLHE
ncbi:TRAP transporter small permease [Albimonas pacifica]|uniref:TRAP transporter small permease protein n=1 Tax=Albimonas pacifica TaxID=1114924 RepID=A0A1I3N0E1_9RHOB|nr:TRAP transporter small permease [Albimonas pacifica]SFJ02475.1 TRAP-type C4-dicarboxylate transport system, small permease component [Albimonas pacifica]